MVQWFFWSVSLHFSCLKPEECAYFSCVLFVSVKFMNHSLFFTNFDKLESKRYAATLIIIIETNSFWAPQPIDAPIAPICSGSNSELLHRTMSTGNYHTDHWMEDIGHVLRRACWQFVTTNWNLKTNELYWRNRSKKPTDKKIKPYQ